MPGTDQRGQQDADSDTAQQGRENGRTDIAAHDNLPCNLIGSRIVETDRTGEKEELIDLLPLEDDDNMHFQESPSLCTTTGGALLQSGACNRQD